MPVGQFARVGFGIRDELLHVFGWEVRVHHQDKSGLTNFANRREIFDGVIRQFAVEVHIGSLCCAGGHQKRIAVCRRRFDGLCSQDTVGTCFVLDGDRLP